jgi:ankyrin repeat protein
MRATANGHSDIVRLLLEAGADPETMDDVRNVHLQIRVYL